MKRLMWVPPVILIMISTSLLNACSFSFQVITTPIPSQPTETSFPSTPTMVPPTPTLILPSATPTQIAINANTILMIEIFKNSQPAGECPQSGIYTRWHGPCRGGRQHRGLCHPSMGCSERRSNRHLERT